MRLRGWRFVAAVVCVVAVLAAACGAGDGEEAVPEEAVPEEPVGDSDGTDWARVSHDEAVFGGPGYQVMSSVVATGSGLVAVGLDESQGDGDAAVWTSVDGTDWARVSHNEAVFGGPDDQAMSSVVATGSGLVAVGRDASQGDADAAAVWTSVDGTDWARVSHDEAVFGGSHDQVMFSVVATGSSLVAVGRDVSQGDGDAAVWTSVDGTDWTRVSHDEAVFGGPDNQAMSSVVATGAGLVAVGLDESQGDGDAAVWTSVDGTDWARVSHDEAVFGGPDDQVMSSVVATGSGLVAVGRDASQGDADAAAVWTSVDGTDWARVSHDEAVFGGPDDQVMISVVATGSGLVAVGRDASQGDADAAAVWTSVDGADWARVSHDEAVFGGSDRQVMSSVAATGSSLVAVGVDTSSDDSDAAVWVGR